MDTFKKIIKNRQAFIGLLIVTLLILIAIFAPHIVPHDPNRPSLFMRYERPQGIGGTYILGADNLGRDVLSRILMGTRVTLQVGIIAVGLSLLAGGILGALAGYIGGLFDEIIMRIMDVILSFPSVLLAILVVAIIGPGFINCMFAIAIVRTPSMARVTRAQVLGTKEEDYVLAARALGCQHWKILFRHIIVNSFAPMLVIATMGMGTAVIMEASLSFLGLGTQPPAISWGRMLSTARESIQFAPHVTLFTGLSIFITVLGFNLLGDGLRDIFDPRLKD